jgi:DegV family protein with EDD domain
MIKIIADTTAGLDPAWLLQHPIPYIPQVIYFGEESFLELETMSQADFLRRLKSASVMPRTAAPPPGLFIKAFQELEADKNTILCIHPSAVVSGTCRSAQLAKDEAFPHADIRIIDTRTIAAQLGAMVMWAQEWVEAGLDADTIEARLNDLIARSRSHFLVATLEYLQRGGRIGGAASIIGQLLQVKPILTVRDGQVEALSRERTMKRAMARLCELVLDEMDASVSPCLQIMHSEAPEQAQELFDTFKKALNRDDFLTMNLVPAIVTHSGPGTVGVGFTAKR